MFDRRMVPCALMGDARRIGRRPAVLRIDVLSPAAGVNLPELGAGLRLTEIAPALQPDQPFPRRVPLRQEQPRTVARARLPARAVDAMTGMNVALRARAARLLVDGNGTPLRRRDRGRSSGLGRHPDRNGKRRRRGSDQRGMWRRRGLRLETCVHRLAGKGARPPLPRAPVRAGGCRVMNGRRARRFAAAATQDEDQPRPPSHEAPHGCLPAFSRIALAVASSATSAASRTSACAVRIAPMISRTFCTGGGHRW